MQTAVVESSGAANPHVPVMKLWVVSLSPTFAGRDLTLCRLKSHMAEELLSCERPTNPDPLAKNGPLSQHARLAKDTCSRLSHLLPPIQRFGGSVFFLESWSGWPPVEVRLPQILALPCTCHWLCFPSAKWYSIERFFPSTKPSFSKSSRNSLGGTKRASAKNPTRGSFLCCASVTVVVASIPRSATIIQNIRRNSRWMFMISLPIWGLLRNRDRWSVEVLTSSGGRPAVSCRNMGLPSLG